MIAKRFIFLDGFSLRYTCICDNQKGHRTNGVLKQDEVLELLNHLHEENEQLKHKLQQQELEYATTCNRLAEENEQLKKELDCFKPLIFETDGMPITLYEKKGGGDVE